MAKVANQAPRTSAHLQLGAGPLTASTQHRFLAAIVLLDDGNHLSTTEKA